MAFGGVLLQAVAELVTSFHVKNGRRFMQDLHDRVRDLYGAQVGVGEQPTRNRLKAIAESENSDPQILDLQSTLSTATRVDGEPL